jgi:hypothetical protein
MPDAPTTTHRPDARFSPRPSAIPRGSSMPWIHAILSGSPAAANDLARALADAAAGGVPVDLVAVVRS